MINITGPVCNEVYYTCAELCANVTGWCECQSPYPLIDMCLIGNNILPVVIIVIIVIGVAIMGVLVREFWPWKKRRRKR